MNEKWKFLLVCKKCEELLSKQEIYRSHGVCPKCGTDSNGTIVDYKKVIYQQIRKTPFWALKTEYEYIGRDDFSKEWLKTHKCDSKKK